MDTANPPPAGWYRDRTNADLLRYWDGEAWTQHTHARPQPAREGFAQAAAPPTHTASEPIEMRDARGTGDARQREY